MNRLTRTLTLILTVFTLCAVLAPAASAGPLIQLLINNGFEDDIATLPVLDPWTLKNKTSDKIVCEFKAPVDTIGDCAFKFKGGIAESAVLKQTVTNVAGLNTILADGPGFMSVNFRYNSPTAAGKIKSVMVVRYTQPGDPIEKVAKNITIGEGATEGWATKWPTVLSAIPEDATILSVNVKIKNRSESGKLYIDDVNAVFSTNNV